MFEMGANFEDEWNSDNKKKPIKQASTETKEPNKHSLHIAKEKRRGKVVTIAKPFLLDKNDMKILLKILKKSLGTGGTVKDNTLELQGDIPGKLRQELEELNYSFKR